MPLRRPSGHGFGVRKTNPAPVSGWTSLFLEWMNAPGPAETLGAVVDLTISGLSFGEIGRTRISCYVALDRAACAAFIEESRMECIKADKLHRKSGQAKPEGNSTEDDPGTKG